MCEEEEDQDVTHLPGIKCQSLSAGEVWVYASKNLDYTNWEKQQKGVVCVVKDDQHQSFYIRVFSTEQNTLLWEMEMKPDFNYKTFGPCFYTFKNCQTGLNFTDSKEAGTFKRIVEDKMKYTREVWQHRQDSSENSTKEPRKKEKKEKKGKTKKSDIGTPTDFQHIFHVGFSGEKGLQFSYYGLEPKDFEGDTSNQDLRQFAEKFGLTKEQLRKKKAREAISKFIYKHGGIKTALEEGTVNELQLPKTPPPKATSQAPSSLNPQKTADCTDAASQVISATECPVTVADTSETKLQAQPVTQQGLTLQRIVEETAESTLTETVQSPVRKQQKHLKEAEQSKPTVKPKPTPRENQNSPVTVVPESHPEELKQARPPRRLKPSTRYTRQSSPTVTPHPAARESKEITPTVAPKPSPRSRKSPSAVGQTSSSSLPPQPIQRKTVSSSPAVATRSSPQEIIHSSAKMRPQPALRRASSPTEPSPQEDMQSQAILNLQPAPRRKPQLALRLLSKPTSPN